MNKKYGIYGLLLLILSNTIQSVALQHNALLNYCISVVVLSGASYLGDKIGAKNYANTLPDAPPYCQKWAREVLINNGLADAHTAPLKMGDGWAVVGGSFVRINSGDAYALEDIFAGKSPYSAVEQKIILADAEYSLLHEKNHYDNGDIGKRCLLNGMIAATVIQATSISDGLIRLGVGVAGNILYERYQEQEADRAAFMNTSSLENLTINRIYYEVKAEQVDGIKGHFSIPVYNNCLTSETMQGISKKLDKVDQTTPRKNRVLFEGVSFISSPAHPSFRSRAELAQECYDKRKADLASKLEKAAAQS